MQLIAISYYYQRDYDKAVEAARRTVAQYPKFHLTYRWLAAAWGSLVARKRRSRRCIWPSSFQPQSFEFYVRHRPPWHPPEDYEHMLDGLRKAGWQG